MVDKSLHRNIIYLNEQRNKWDSNFLAYSEVSAILKFTMRSSNFEVGGWGNFEVAKSKSQKIQVEKA